MTNDLSNDLLYYDTPDLGFNDGQVTLNQGKVEFFFYGTIMPLHHVNYRAAS